LNHKGKHTGNTSKSKRRHTAEDKDHIAKDAFAPDLREEPLDTAADSPGTDAAGGKNTKAEAAAEAADATEAGGAPSDDETELEKSRRQAREYLESLQRLKAEFDNYRKRTARERQRLAELHQSLVLENLLPTLDSFDAALDKAEHTDTESVLHGMRMIYEGLMASLKKLEFEKMDILGDVFNPERAEALMTQPTDDHAPDTVIGVISAGYMFKGRVLRPARVVVSVPAGDSDDTSQSGNTHPESEEASE